MTKINERYGRVSFSRAIEDFFKGYFDFKGESSRAGFWWTMLFLFLVSIPLIILWLVSLALISIFAAHISLTSGLSDFNPMIILVYLYILLLICPTFALFARRLRNVGLKSSRIYPLIIIIAIVFIAELFPISSQPVSFILFLVNFAFAVTFLIFSFLPKDYWHK